MLYLGTSVPPCVVIVVIVRAIAPMGILGAYAASQTGGTTGTGFLEAIVSIGRVDESGVECVHAQSIASGHLARDTCKGTPLEKTRVHG